jgi:cyclopropane-fatty-acyl-phospholipid synthase|eukprot:TRINITY_DN43156_c0_g1_i1.p1 TRINITY_DN43156_c0_g1~~TRINITY_DN43156_c0_g1_i1.p1  ORF type:complete len:415 (-),score=52.10 TRINITY_DN43156_c0_g1_i1:73-1317(-)
MCGVIGCCTLLVVVVAIGVGVLFTLLADPANSEKAVRKIVEVGGIPDTLYDHIQIVDNSSWYDIITKGNLGIAEAYMHGKIKVDPLPFFLTVLNDTSVGTRRKEGTDYLGFVMQLAALPTDLSARLFNMQSRDLSQRVTKEHYDAGNDLYERMLGPTMSYTCAYWKGAETLDQAQTNKFDLIRRKLELSPGMKVADLGMGWGTAAAYMYKHGQVKVTGVSLSEQQVKWARANLAKPGLEFIFSDYRDMCEEGSPHVGYFDRLYSIGMLEHVGYHNYAPFFKCVKRLLKPDGLAVIHTIGEPDFVSASDPFLDKYIFPGAVIPSMGSVVTAFENDFILEDWQNFGYDYARTLSEWNVNAEAFFRENPDRYTVEFQRMWHYYLKMCEALFELRINQLFHFVLSPRPATRKRIDRQL